MGSRVSHPICGSAPRETEHQCLIRDVNEAAECASAHPDTALVALRCECGDPCCRARVTLTHGEYEAVRAYGSHFVVGINHENPENACVLCENAQFAIVDVIAADARYHVLARNPRHAWSVVPDRSRR